ncbi:MAG: adenylosuccinate lyase [Bacteroidales bacterium]|nr:adenylosuccinate lyase [Bacteroidales bacterium]
MKLNELTAISTIDGRYRDKLKELSQYFSEFALIKKRLYVEVLYIIELSKLNLKGFENLPQNFNEDVYNIFLKFNITEAKKIKEIEKKTNHDVKSIEYYIREKFDQLKLDKYKEYIHFGLTSQDINNTAIPLLLKEFIEKIYKKLLKDLLIAFEKISEETKDITMLSHTHGQPASPTKMGKEIEVFIERLQNQIVLLNQVPICAKFGGAIGNFNAHYAAYPEIDWHKFADYFVETILGLKRYKKTTQIEHYDNLAALFDNIRRINVILIDFCRDMWLYISMDYFKQKAIKNEVGSSTMPHKINPIDFENAEGNLMYANAILDFLSNKLPISRLQRDLTDSTVIRNIGIPLAHSILAYKNIIKGISKLQINRNKIIEDLKNNWVVVTEAIQTILRRENYPNAYEELKLLSRKSEKITKKDILRFINKLKVNKKVKNELKKITPFNYTGK